MCFLQFRLPAAWRRPAWLPVTPFTLSQFFQNEAARILYGDVVRNADVWLQRKFYGHINASNGWLAVLRLRGIQALGVALTANIFWNVQKNFKVVVYVFPVPCMHGVKQGYGCSNYSCSLICQQLAQAGIGEG